MRYGADREVVYDPFLSSGTTLIAAELTVRVCRGLTKCNSRDPKDGGWCILSRAGESKMEIPVNSRDLGSSRQ